MFADESDPHDFVRDGRRHARVAAARQLCRGCFFAGISETRRGKPTSRSSAATRSIRSSRTRNTNTPSTATWASSFARHSADWSNAIENDKYGLARELIHPLKPWLRESKFNGPVQVTAIKRGGKWKVIEYNIRIGVTSGPMILRMLKNPSGSHLKSSRGMKKLKLSFNDKLNFGCSLTLAGYGYPFTQVRGPQLPLEMDGKFDCDVWWNEVARSAGRKIILHWSSHRGRDCACAEIERSNCKSLREYSQTPRRGQLFSHGRRTKFVAAGNSLKPRLTRIAPIKIRVICGYFFLSIFSCQFMPFVV